MAMPQLWKLTLYDVMRSVGLMIGGAVLLMVVLQMGEIARFAALAGEWQATVTFIGLQIPYILPNAIPLAGLLGGYWTFRRLSTDQELTALRASGMSLSSLMLPMVCLGLCLGACNWGLSSEVAPQCRAYGKRLFDRVAQLNPLALIHLKRMIKLEGSWISAEPDGQHAAHNLWAIAPAGQDHRLTLLHVGRVLLEKGHLHGYDVLAMAQEGEPGELWVEQSAHAELAATDLAPFLLRSTLSRAEDYLSWSGQWTLACQGCRPAQHEIVRRVALGIAPLFFLLLGCAYGMTSSRYPRRTDLGAAMGLAFLSLGCFMAGKTVPHQPWAFYPLFLLPLGLCAYMALRRLWRMQEGHDL